MTVLQSVSAPSAHPPESCHRVHPLFPVFPEYPSRCSVRCDQATAKEIASIPTRPSVPFEATQPKRMRWKI